jgi:diguanylate cyclase (GGDEF)-like protein
MEVTGQSPGNARPKRTLSIRARLMLLAVAAILPLIVERILDVQSERAERIELASQQALDFARQGMERHYDVIIAARSFLQVLARAYPTVAASGSSCNELLAHMARDIPWAKVVSVSMPNGTVRCSNVAAPAGFSIFDHPFFQQMLRTDGFVTSEYIVGRRTGAPVLYTGFAQRGPDGVVEATFTSAIDLHWIGGLTRSLAERLNTTTLLLDGGGTVLAGYPDRGNLVGRRLGGGELARQILARSEGVVTAAAIDGVRRIYGFLQLPGTNTRLVIGLDESEVLRRVNRETLTSFAQLAAIAALVLIGIWFGGERLFVRPLRTLAQTAGNLGRGERAASTEARWAAEFIPLATVLGDVAGQLAERERELRATAGRLQELAEIDSLTGLANRRAFDDKLDAEWTRAMRAGHSVALLMIDVDHFKPFNDHYGHVAGDACLRQVGEVLSAEIRTGRTGVPRGDVLARYGGEEFVALLPGVGLDRAVKVAERLRVAVESLAIAHAAAPGGHLTVSIGVAADRPSPELRCRALMEAADAALYAAKRLGRNKVATARVASASLAEAS